MTKYRVDTAKDAGKANLQVAAVAATGKIQSQAKTAQQEKCSAESGEYPICKGGKNLFCVIFSEENQELTGVFSSCSGTKEIRFLWIFFRKKVAPAGRVLYN